jgi:hypothetical protein
MAPRSILCLSCGAKTALLEIGAPPEKCESCKRLLFPDHVAVIRKRASAPKKKSPARKIRRADTILGR